MLVYVTREIDEDNSCSGVILRPEVIYRIRTLTKSEKEYLEPFNSNGYGYKWNLKIEGEDKRRKKCSLYLMSFEFREWIKDGTMVIINES